MAFEGNLSLWQGDHGWVLGKAEGPGTSRLEAGHSHTEYGHLAAHPNPAATRHDPCIRLTCELPRCRAALPPHTAERLPPAPPAAGPDGTWAPGVRTRGYSPTWKGAAHRAAASSAVGENPGLSWSLANSPAVDISVSVQPQTAAPASHLAGFLP